MKVAISADNTASASDIPQSLHDLFVLEQGSIPFGRKTSPFCTGLAGVEGEYDQGNDGGIQKDKDQPQIYFLCCCFDHNVFASPSLSVITEITILKIMNSISTMESPLPRFQLPVWVNSCSMTLPMSRILLPPKILLITKVVRGGDKYHSDTAEHAGQT